MAEGVTSKLEIKRTLLLLGELGPGYLDLRLVYFLPKTTDHFVEKFMNLIFLGSLL